MSKNEKKTEKNDKVFEDCDSLLTKLLEDNNFRAIKNFFYVLLVVHIFQELNIYFLHSKSSTFGFGLLQRGLEKFHMGIPIWFLLFGLNLLVVPIFRLWAYARTEISPTLSYVRTYDVCALTSVISYYVCSLYFVGKFVNKTNLGYLAAMIIHLENARFIMKAHAFIRTNAPKVLRYKQHSDETLELPRISKYLYFSFAPTLIYRDTYPRRKNIDKLFAISCFFDMFCVIWLTGFIFEKLYINLYGEAGLVKMDLIYFVSKLLENFLYGVYFSVFLFYVLLHCWYNGMAEILRFADRKFYGAWWCSKNYTEFYRTWNVPVQDWLYCYVYKDVKEILTDNNKSLAKIAVLLLSAFMHEYITLSILQQTFPIIFWSMVVITGPLLFLKLENKFFNVIFLLNMISTVTMTVVLYVIEVQTLRNCPPAENNVFLQYVPRMFTADCY